MPTTVTTDAPYAQDLATWLRWRTDRDSDPVAALLTLRRLIAALQADEALAAAVALHGNSLTYNQLGPRLGISKQAALKRYRSAVNRLHAAWAYAEGPPSSELRCLLCDRPCSRRGAHACAAGLRVGYTGSREAWTGALRDDHGEVVADCGHVHRVRDHSNSVETAATSCAGLLLEALQVGQATVRNAEEWAVLVAGTPNARHAETWIRSARAAAQHAAKLRGSVLAHLRQTGILPAA